MLRRTDDYVMTSTQDSFFDLDYRFGYEQGFNVAVAFTAIENRAEDILTPDIGRIVFRHYTFGPDVDNQTYLAQDYLPTHVCSNEELGIDRENENSFFPFKDTNDLIITKAL